MARPKLGASETERLHLKITQDELTAIDDWRFANRVPSRSEAVRRLCQIGLRSDNDLEYQVDLAKSLREYSVQFEIELFDYIKRHSEAGDKKTAKALEDVLRQSFNLTEQVNRMYIAMVASYNQLVPLADARSFQDAVSGAQQAAAESQIIFDEIKRKDRELEENKIIASVVMGMTEEERQNYEALSEDEKDVWWEKIIATKLKEQEEKQENEN